MKPSLDTTNRFSEVIRIARLRRQAMPQQSHGPTAPRVLLPAAPVEADVPDTTTLDEDQDEL